MALLHAIHALQKEKKLHLEVAHVDHGLRKESASDALFVKKLASDLGLVCHLKKCRKKPRSANTEAWGRLQRYQFFEKILTARKLDLIVTAHTANDVAETLLMRLVTNKELRTIEPLDLGRQLIRPILSVPRLAIDQYIRRYKLQFREDITNADTAFLRNRIRRRLLPVLERDFDRRIIETLAERARGLDDDARALYEMAEQQAIGTQREEWGSKSWLRSVQRALKGCPQAVGWRMVQNLMLPKLGFRLGRDKCTEVISFFERRASAVELPGGVRLSHRSGGVALSR